MTWRSLYVRGRFVQRNLAELSALRQLAVHSGLHLPLGKELWELWDEEGVLRPIAFGLGRWHTDAVLDPERPDTVVFREEQPFRPWDDYAVDYDFASEPHPEYSPWQLLPMHDAVAGRSVDLSVDVLLDEERREAWLDRLKSLLEGQRSAWKTLDERWASTLKLLVAGQNRFWPAISGRVVLPWDFQRGERVDPMAGETADFEPESVLAAHGVSESELASIYEWLVERGARIEGGEAPFTDGGDRWARLRRLADRREQRNIRGPARAALDFYEAAELLGRWWSEITGRYLPGIEAVPRRRTTKPIEQDAVDHTTHERTREALRSELIAHGLWPGRIHAVVEGDTEEAWVRELVGALFGYVPSELLCTSIHGTGGAKRIERIVETIADYALSSTLLVDREGEMARYVTALIEAEALDERDVLMFDSSFEEANFTDQELVAVARTLAANPPGERPAVEVRLTADELRQEHQHRCADARPGAAPGLANTLLELLREERYGPVNLKKLELSQGLLEAVLDELGGGTPIQEVAARRPVVRFVVERIADPLANQAWH